MRTKRRDDLIIVKEARIENTVTIGGTAVTATASEINVLDGAVAGATITVGDEAEHVVPVTIQLNDAKGAAIAARACILAYITSDANGDTFNTTAGMTVGTGTDGTALALVADKVALLISEADGDIDLTVEHDGTASAYLQLVMPNGKKVASGALTWAGG